MRSYSPAQDRKKRSLTVKTARKLRYFHPFDRIYLDENGKITDPAPDADKWRQCWTCGLIVGVYETRLEAELDTITEPRTNPFNVAQVRTEESRKFDRTGKTQRKRKFKQDLEQYKEQDVKEALRKGKTLVSYQES